MNEQAFVNWFRQAGPYINAHRGKTFVILFSGEAVASASFSGLINDLALLHGLGVRLVLVHGARPQIEARLAEAGIVPRYVEGLRITDETLLPYVKEAVGRVSIVIESRLSMGLPNSPMHGARIRVSSGNNIVARPVGVREGIDYCFTGEVRRIDTQAINTWLDAGAIVLLSPLGYSATGEVFNVSSEEVAIAAAMALRADKLLILSEGADLLDERGLLIRQMVPSEVENLLTGTRELPTDIVRHLRCALRACRAGVRRIHLLRRGLEGALLLELFTRDGVGTLVNGDLYEGMRLANIEDVGGILELIRPLEDEGILVRRSRERLETEIGRFTVFERDGAVIGCAALYPFPEEQVGELACVAMSPDYRNSGRAEALLRFVEQQAHKQQLQRLFVLTTHAAHWFQEHGFEPAELHDLPVQKQALYNFQRRSKVFIKTL